MTTMAYMAFVFIACVIGLGVGLVLHRLRSNRLTPPPEEAFAGTDSATADLEHSIDALYRWHAANNRSFALHMGICGGVPLLLGLLGWTIRSDVLNTLCSGLYRVSSQPPVCF